MRFYMIGKRIFYCNYKLNDRRSERQIRQLCTDTLIIDVSFDLIFFYFVPYHLIKTIPVFKIAII